MAIATAKILENLTSYPQLLRMIYPQFGASKGVDAQAVKS